MTCPTCNRKLANNAKVCPSCQHDFVADRRQKALVAAILGLIFAAVAAIIGLVLLSPGIIINTIRGRYRNRTRGLLSSALRDWQTWLISLPFAIPVIVVTINSWNEISAERTAREQHLAHVIEQSQTESRELALIIPAVDRSYFPSPTEVVITDVSMKSKYSPEYGEYSPASSVPPPVVFFRDLPQFRAEETNTVQKFYLINFDEQWVLRFENASKRDKVLRTLSEAVNAWRGRFPEAVKSKDTPRHLAAGDNEQVASTEIRRPVPVLDQSQPPANQRAAEIQFYSVVGVATGDTLNVRSGPGGNNAVTARLPNGYRGIRVIGASVMNDTTEWVPISFETQSGWVRKQYLQAE